MPKLEFEKYTLPNGLQVILHVDRKLPIVHVNQWFHVGSKNEKRGRTGFAHLFEHMMFQGSKNATGEYFVYAEKAGANLAEGGVNGTTDNDRTNYFATVPSGNLENLLWLESDRLATLLDTTDIKKLDEQRNVVKNERRQGLENQPYGRWFPLLFENMFDNGHPYSWPVIGSMEDLSAATLDDVKEFFRQYYTPNNLSLVIAGDFDPAEAKKLVEKYFGDLPPGAPLDRPARNVATLDGERVVEVNDRVSLERVYIGWPAPEYFATDDAALDIAARILADGLSSRLNKALVYDKPLATQVSSFNVSREIASVFVVQATARPGTSLAEIEAGRRRAEIARLAKEGPTTAELERAKTKQEAEFVSGLERIGGFGGKADVLNQYNVFLGDPDKIEADLGRYRALTTAAVQKAVATWLDTPNRVVIRFHPEKAQRPADALTLDRSTMPPLGADRPFAAPTVETAKLPNGLELFVVERRDSAEGQRHAGHPRRRRRRSGGQGRRRQPDDHSHRHGHEDAQGARDRAGLRRSGHDADRRRRPRERAAGLGRAVAQPLAGAGHPRRRRAEPDVPGRGDRARAQARAGRDRAGAIAAATRSTGAIQPMLAFGPEHPYGRPVQGLKGSVEGITRADLVAFHQARVKPGSTAIVLAGDISLAQATELATKHFGTWSGGAAAAITIPPVPAPKGGRIYLVDRPDAAQTVVGQWIPGPARKTPDYDVLNLVDAVWGGGGFGTRLNLNLRENKAYSYGVFSNFNLMRAAGNWSAAGGVQTDKTAESIVEFDKELKDLAGARPDQRRRTGRRQAAARARLRAAVRVARPDHGRDRQPVGVGSADGGAAAGVRRDQRGDARAGRRGVEEIRAARPGLAAAGRRPLEDRGQGQGAQPRRDRRARHRRQAGGDGTGHGSARVTGDD